MKCKQLFRAVLIGLVLIAGCASLPLKQQAVVSLQASELALEAAHDAERALCSPTADQTKPITHCDGAQAATIGLTDARHQQLAGVFAKAFATEVLAASALKAWHAGEPAPASLADYQRDIQALVLTVLALIPQAQAIVSKSREAETEARTSAQLMGVN